MSTWKNGKGRDAVVEVLATMKMGEDYFSEESKDATMKFLEKDLKQEAMKGKLLIARGNKKRDAEMTAAAKEEKGKVKMKMMEASSFSSSPLPSSPSSTSSECSDYVNVDLEIYDIVSSAKPYWPQVWGLLSKHKQWVNFWYVKK